MAKLPAVSGREARRAFEQAGWRFARQAGGHMILTKPGTETTLSVPAHRELKRGTLRALIRQAGLDVDSFVHLLRRE